MHSCRHFFSGDSLQFIQNKYVVPAPLRTGPGGQPFLSVSPLVCLGVALGAEGSTCAQITHRIDQARGAWFKSRALLLFPALAADERYRLLQGTVGASMFYGAGSWMPSAHASARGGRPLLGPRPYFLGVLYFYLVLSHAFTFYISESRA